MYKKILVPLDGSPFAEEALQHAQALANAEHGEVIILRVPLVPAPEYFGRNTALASNISGDVDKESAKYVRAEIKKMENEGTRVTGMIREGPVSETIVEVAEEIHADAIAMATHGRTGFQRWLKGSVAEDVARHTHIPVILIHPN